MKTQAIRRVGVLKAALLAALMHASAIWAGGIEGTVTDSATGTALAGVWVEIRDPSGNYVAGGPSGATGAFSIGGVPDGTYFVQTYNTLGYIDELYDNIPCLNCGYSGGTPVVVSGGATTAGINFGLTKGGRIAGTIRDALTLAPLANAGIILSDTSGSQVSTAVTDAAGNYTSGSGVPTGTYFAQAFSGPDYISELFDNVPCASASCGLFASATPIAVSAGTTTSGIDFSLSHGGSVAGTVVDAATNLPLMGVRVSIRDAANTEVSSTSTDASGAYFESGLRSGTYYATTTNGSGYVDQLYAGIPCVGSCFTRIGTAIPVVASATSAGIDFALSQGGRVSGTIRDAVTLAPLAFVGVNVLSATGSYLTSGSSDATGRYTTSAGLPAGTYIVRTNNGLGYLDELYDNRPCVGNFCTTAGGTTVTVPAGGTIAGIDFDLTRGGRFAGLVTAAGTGAPLRGVGVSILTATGTEVARGSTDSTGNYVTEPGVPAGTYFARTDNSQGFLNQRYGGVACNGSLCPTTGGTGISTTLGTTTSGINFILNPGARVEGVVTDSATAQPLSNAGASIVDAAGSTLTSGRTDTLGNYLSLTGLAPGSYFVRAYATGYIGELFDNIPCPPVGCANTGGTAVAVPAAGTAPGVNFALDQGGTITGTVRDSISLAPLANVTVDFYDGVGEQVNFGITDSFGHYSTTGLPAGVYKAQTSNSLGYVNELYNHIPCPPGCSPAAGAPISVALGATTAGIDFDLTAGGRIAGTVVDQATGLPLAEVNVSIVTPAGAYAASALTDPAGNYVSGSGLLPGTYYVQTANGQGYINQLYGGGPCVGTCTLATGTAVTVGGSSTVGGIDFALSRGGRVAGVVTDASSAVPLSRVVVNVYDASGRSVTSGSSDALGSYVVRAGLPSGTYFARTANSSGYIDDLYDNKQCLGTCPVTQGTAFSVTVGATTSGIDFALNPGGRISGTVTAAGTGLPVSGVNVLLYDSSGRSVASGFTDLSGNYSTYSGLPAGTYYARTSNRRGYVNELYGGATCTGACVVTTGTPIVVPASGTLGGIDFNLAAGGRIAGTVTRAGAGAALPSISLQVFDSSGTLVTSATTDFFGQWLSNDGLTAGTYFVRTSNSQGFIDQLYQTPAPVPCLACVVTSGAPIAVTLGATTAPVDFALSPGARLAGTITRTPGSAPIPNVSVALMDNAGTTVATATSDGLGHYATDSGVPTGTYFARTQNAQGFVDQFWNGHPCVSSCTVTNGDAIALSAGAIATGFDFALVLDADSDADGISNTIDRNASSGADESAVVSNDFSDVPLAGTTAGTITSRGGFSVTVGDINPGVQVSVSGAGTVATFEVCPLGGPEGLSLDVAGETATITCTPGTGSTTVRALQATPVIELRDPPTGPGVVVLLTTGQTATIGSPVKADASNTEPIRIQFVDAAGVTFGSFDLDPGESVDARVNAAGGVDTTVIAGTVTITVRGDSATLSQGQSHTFPGTDPTPAIRAAILAIEHQVDQLRAARQIRNDHVAREIKESLAAARHLVGHHNGAANAHLRVAIWKIVFFAHRHWITPPAKHTLVAAIAAVLTSIP